MTADSLTANLPILYRFSYLLLWEGHIFPSDSVVQSRPPCIQCRTSEQAVFRPAGAMTRSSPSSSQPLLACAVTHIDLGHVIHCLWPLLKACDKQAKPCRQGCGNLVQPWNFCMARVCKGLHQQIQVKNISSVATVAILQIS